uniref:Uncharacterized protein n=1 Tax=Coccidioides posadasii RMSCC 3488 TaxID=454284 RepID=A0A0J6ILR8_COCPO|nr:hypothetical protein CPAG_09167 [Coccidioides posadasii RMSCC 3488]
MGCNRNSAWRVSLGSVSDLVSSEPQRSGFIDGGHSTWVRYCLADSLEI